VLRTPGRPFSLKAVLRYRPAQPPSDNHAQKQGVCQICCAVHEPQFQDVGKGLRIRCANCRTIPSAGCAKYVRPLHMALRSRTLDTLHAGGHGNGRGYRARCPAGKGKFRVGGK
jgi:hypothetical protein